MLRFRISRPPRRSVQKAPRVRERCFLYPTPGKAILIQDLKPNVFSLHESQLKTQSQCLQFGIHSLSTVSVLTRRAPTGTIRI